MFRSRDDFRMEMLTQVEGDKLQEKGKARNRDVCAH